MIFEVVLIFALLCLVSFFPTAKLLLRRYKLGSKFSGPPALPIFGNAFVYQGKQPHEFGDILYSFVVKYGDCYRIWLGSELNLFFSSLKDIEAILGDSRFNNKSTQYEYLRPWLNQGLLISENRKWIRRRRIINPAFHFRTLEVFVHVFDKHSRWLVKKLRQMQEHNQIELYHLFSLTALDVICGECISLRCRDLRQLAKEIARTHRIKISSSDDHRGIINLGDYKYKGIINISKLTAR